MLQCAYIKSELLNVYLSNFNMEIGDVGLYVEFDVINESNESIYIERNDLLINKIPFIDKFFHVSNLEEYEESKIEILTNFAIDELFNSVSESLGSSSILFREGIRDGIITFEYNKGIYELVVPLHVGDFELEYSVNKEAIYKMVIQCHLIRKLNSKTVYVK